MLEVKVICPCGTKFKFDTEPVDGRMAAPVICPRCNEDRTQLANQVIAAKLAAAAPAESRFGIGAPAMAAPSAPLPVTPAAPAAPKPGPVRVGSAPSGPRPVPVVPSAKPAPDSESGPPVPPAAASAGTAPPPTPVAAKPGLKVGNQPHVAKADPTGPPPVPPGAGAVAKVDDGAKGKAKPAVGSRKPSFALACVGAILGAIVGTAVWVAVIYFTGIRSGYVALLVGVSSGFGARLLGRGTSVGFGVIAAVFALTGILGGNLIAFTARVADAVTEGVAGAYEQRVSFAKEVVAAKNDDELKKAAVRELATDRADPKTISAADLQKFKAEEMPRLKALAEGKVARAELEAQLAAEIMTKLDYGEVFARIFSIGAIISWIIALVAAFRIASK